MLVTGSWCQTPELPHPRGSWQFLPRLWHLPSVALVCTVQVPEHLQDWELGSTCSHESSILQNCWRTSQEECLCLSQGQASLQPGSRTLSGYSVLYQLLHSAINLPFQTGRPMPCSSAANLASCGIGGSWWNGLLSIIPHLCPRSALAPCPSRVWSRREQSDCQRAGLLSGSIGWRLGETYRGGDERSQNSQCFPQGSRKLENCWI